MENEEMETKEYSTIDKSGWGSGPWLSEPDKRQWADEATGLPCLIARGPMGALCGYVGVSPDHPAYGRHYYSPSYDEDGNATVPTALDKAIDDLDVHGGLTYARACDGSAEDRGICHVPGDSEPDHVWWFGFDCAHSGDYAPDLRSKTPWEEYGVESYRTLSYVAEQCASLAKQLAEIPV
jgi:hypothetical protein